MPSMLVTPRFSEVDGCSMLASLVVTGQYCTSCCGPCANVVLDAEFGCNDPRPELEELENEYKDVWPSTSIATVSSSDPQHISASSHNRPKHESEVKNEALFCESFLKALVSEYVTITLSTSPYPYQCVVSARCQCNRGFHQNKQQALRTQRIPTLTT
uniref:Uncharacterized protein n=1 Tax=Glossina palpalis gambiensis TaxID=67801 RepID=A0A1B0C1V5_9MUSC